MTRPLRSYLAYRALKSSQWLDRPKLRERQEKRLRELVSHAYGTVPYYRALMDEAGISPSDVSSLGELKRIPTTSKADLQAAGRVALTSDRYRAGSLHEERTSGSSGRPFTVLYDRRFVAIRNGIFLRALTAAGYRLGMRLLLLTAGGERRRAPVSRWRYASIEDPADRLLRQLEEFRPQVLYGATTPLRNLARSASEAGSDHHRPRIVVSTAEALDGETRRLLADTFAAEVYDVYGLTEAGVVGWECRERRGYHISEDTTIVEFLEPPGVGAPPRIVITNLELRAMPFLRLETGDLGVPAADGRCGCGRFLRRIARVEGRAVDCLRLPGGRLVSPYRLTAALEKLPGIRRFQVVQEQPLDFLVRIEAGGAEESRLREEVRRVVAESLGADGREARIQVKREASLEGAPGRKYRVVECRMSATSDGPPL